MLDGDLGYTCFVATTFKGRIKESCEDSLDLLFADEACGDGGHHAPDADALGAEHGRGVL